MNGVTSFLIAAAKKTSAELSATLADPAKLSAAAAYHNIPVEWAQFYAREELSRSDRRN